MSQQITPQQQAILAQLQHAQAQPPGARPPVSAPTRSTNAGVTTTLKHLSDGDEQYRNAKRRKPTSLSLPTHFALATTASSGPTDKKLAPSLASLEKLSTSYRALQQVESKLDWTFSRKAIELTEKASAKDHGDQGERVQRTMRIHAEFDVVDQEWQLDPDAIANQVKDDPERVPKIKVKLSGQILDDESQAKVPFTKHYQRVTIECPFLTTPLTWNRTPSTNFPSSLNFTIPYSLPRPVEPSSSDPSGAPSTTDPVVQIKVTLHPFAYPQSQTSQLFTVLPPDLSSLLNVSECTRSEALHHLWLYIRSHHLIIENLDGRGTGGIKTQEATTAANPTSGGGGPSSSTSPAPGGGLSKKYFGGVEKIAWHHLGEWVNRWLGPVVPRVIDLKFSPAAPTSTSGEGDDGKKLDHHQAFDVPVSIFPNASTSSIQARLQQKTISLLSTLTSSSASPSTSDSAPPNLNDPLSGGSNAVVQALEALNSQIANSTLAVVRHKLELDSLLAFARDPTKFLNRYLASQDSNLETVLNGRSLSSQGIGMGLGDGWKESLRGSQYFNNPGRRDGGEVEGRGEWVKEAVGVWLAREREGELRKVLVNRQGTNNPTSQQQQQMAGYGRR
ncbi:hypothetical protein JCM3766R1_001835 [Sporobolomyces carnicolor]